MEVDKEKALYLYTQAAQEGNIYAQLELAYRYDQGEGVEVNKEKARHWYSIAQEPYGCIDELLELAYRYDQGEDVEVNKEKAAYWYALAREERVKDRGGERGFALEQYDLARKYAGGYRGLKVDKRKALYWYTKAADYGDTQAMHDLGIMYYKGDGIEKNSELAKKYFEQACEQKLKESCDILHKGIK
ncbi:tetratricopeptide repeat protein [Gilliamella sp. B2923]|uniref:tetratricopeptide repeat protein n=1 Tax=Gilliamella sp. B2923 TaxID=2818005 RepID=UPI00226A1942|nr:tetratricopeptide repeat protein [Gilliamella sp. B2923]